MLALQIGHANRKGYRAGPATDKLRKPAMRLYD
jgi:hypothetical protein